VRFALSISSGTLRAPSSLSASLTVWPCDSGFQ
jgi:hypothetical protein